MDYAETESISSVEGFFKGAFPFGIYLSGEPKKDCCFFTASASIYEPAECIA